MFLENLISKVLIFKGYKGIIKTKVLQCNIIKVSKEENSYMMKVKDGFGIV